MNFVIILLTDIISALVFIEAQGLNQILIIIRIYLTW